MKKEKLGLRIQKNPKKRKRFCGQRRKRCRKKKKKKRGNRKETPKNPPLIWCRQGNRREGLGKGKRNYSVREGDLPPRKKKRDPT